MRQCACGSFAINVAIQDKTRDICDVCYYRTPLLNLLAFIHRDGGQYIAEHGMDKAIKDAAKIIAKWRAE